jgi:hypothetical protein
MHPGRIAGATHKLSAPENWDKQKSGPCQAIHVRAVMTAAGAVMTSAWFPTPEEIQRLLRGAPIYLTIAGTQHPPVQLLVGEATHC